jgi:hypothetical protein
LAGLAAIALGWAPAVGLADADIIEFEVYPPAVFVKACDDVEEEGSTQHRCEDADNVESRAEPLFRPPRQRNLTFGNASAVGRAAAMDGSAEAHTRSPADAATGPSTRAPMAESVAGVFTSMDPVTGRLTLEVDGKPWIASVPASLREFWSFVSSSTGTCLVGYRTEGGTRVVAPSREWLGSLTVPMKEWNEQVAKLTEAKDSSSWR